MNRTREDYEGQPMYFPGEPLWLAGISLIMAALMIAGMYQTYTWITALFR